MTQAPALNEVSLAGGIITDQRRLDFHKPGEFRVFSQLPEGFNAKV